MTGENFWDVQNEITAGQTVRERQAKYTVYSLGLKLTKDYSRSWMFVETWNQFPGNYLKNIADYQTLAHLAYAGTFPTVVHSQ